VSNNLYFKDHYGGTRLLAANVDEDAAWDLMKKSMESHNFKHYYTRVWSTDSNGHRGTWYDVGSHTEFFFWGVIEDD
jgi:hypothetical protein